MVKEYRHEMGADLLLMMKDAGDLPLPSGNITGQVMMGHYKTEGLIDDLRAAKMKWRPTAQYWESHLKDCGVALRKRGYHFDFKRYQDDDGILRGEWKFLTKKEEATVLLQENNGISKRSDTHNDKLDDSTYAHNIPHTAEVPLLN